MKINFNQKQTIDRIEQQVCSYFKISEQDIINKDNSEVISNARHFLWYMLHFKLEMSPLSISKIYFRQPRTVKRGYAKIKSGIKYHSYYQTMYKELEEKIEPLIPKDIERFWERNPENNR